MSDSTRPDRLSLTVAEPSTPEEKQHAREKEQRARRAVAHHAHDADDCRQLLDMIGLLPGGQK